MRRRKQIRYGSRSLTTEEEVIEVTWKREVMMKKWVCLAKCELELLVGISRESAWNLSSGPSIKRPQKTKNEKKKKNRKDKSREIVDI